MRSTVLWGVISFLCSTAACFSEESRTLDAAMDQADRVLWERFVSPFDFLYDYVGEHPTAEDCELGRPNAIGWWSPIENGAMFTGLYLPAVCKRALRTQNAADREHARRLSCGLLRCAPRDVPGFISRGVAQDGKSYYLIGSADQTAPWFHGLWCYLQTDIPTVEERREITERMVVLMKALEKNGWYFPCAGRFSRENRGEMVCGRFLETPCFLFMLRATYELTRDEHWLHLYTTSLKEVPQDTQVTHESDGRSDGKRNRLKICADGFPPDEQWLHRIAWDYMWIYVKCQYALVELEKLETDPVIREAYREGICRNAAACWENIRAGRNFQNDDSKLSERERLFGADWRKVYPHWEPQNTLADVMRVQGKRDDRLFGGRKGYERQTVTNPLACAATVGLAVPFAPEETARKYREILKAALSHYDYDKIRLSEFFYGTIGYEYGCF